MNEGRHKTRKTPDREKMEYLGLSEVEANKARTILADLSKFLVPDAWTVVGGLPFRYYYLKKTGQPWNHPFNDLDIISPEESVLQPEVCKQFDIRHHHSKKEKSNFYFQLNHKSFPEITIDIFGRSTREQHDSRLVNLFGRQMKITTPEEMYLSKLRDILFLLNSPRGLPPKHIEQLRFLSEIIDRKKVEALWQQRHQVVPKLEDIYQFPSLEQAEDEVEKILKEKRENIKEWIKSDPDQPCQECIRDPRFPLLRDLRAK